MADGIAISGRCLNHFSLLLTLGWCYCLIFGCCYCQLPWYWQMLLSPLRLMLLPYFRWLIADVMPYILAGVIANFVEDVKPHIV